jgi:hypothetical protein
MLLRRQYFPFCVLFLFALTSCGLLNRYIYRANPINLPGLTEKGQSRVTAAFDGNIQGIGPAGVIGEDLAAAYAVSDRITLLGSYSHRVGDDGGFEEYAAPVGFGPPVNPYDSAAIHYRNSTWELGAAYTLPLNRHTYFSIGAGGGGGVFHIAEKGLFNDTAYQGSFNYRAAQWFIQPAFYFKWRRVELGVGFRVTGTYFVKAATDFTMEQQKAFTVNGLKGNNLIMWQPFWLLRISPRSWLQIELQSSINTGGSTSTGTAYNYYYFNFGAGLSVNPTRIFSRANTSD